MILVKRIVVVVDENNKEWFEDDNLHVVLRWKDSNEIALEIYKNNEVIGHFKKWIYWRAVP